MQSTFNIDSERLKQSFIFINVCLISSRRIRNCFCLMLDNDNVTGQLISLRKELPLCTFLFITFCAGKNV